MSPPSSPRGAGRESRCGGAAPAATPAVNGGCGDDGEGADNAAAPGSVGGADDAAATATAAPADAAAGPCGGGNKPAPPTWREVEARETWSAKQEKAFAKACRELDGVSDGKQRWTLIAGRVDGKTRTQCSNHAKFLKLSADDAAAGGGGGAGAS